MLQNTLAKTGKDGRKERDEKDGKELISAGAEWWARGVRAFSGLFYWKEARQALLISLTF